MNNVLTTVVCLGVLLAFATAGPAVTIETVGVGDPNNAGEWSGENYGGSGPDRFCGAVGYEYHIGKYEVTAGQYCEFLNAVADTDTYGLYDPNMDTAVKDLGCNITQTGSSGSYQYSVAPDWADRPVNFVSWGDAARFANWLHNGQPTGAQSLSTTEDGAYYLNGATTTAELMAVAREPDATWVIPTEDEWYKAAYYKGGSTNAGYWDYPTGSDSVPGRDMTEGTNPGNNANYYSGDFLIGSPYYRTPVGEFELSDSPYGTFDQGGNVFEWNEAIIYSIRGFRGGSFGVTDGAMPASNRNYYLIPTMQNGIIGFRVAEVPEPTCLAILALGGAGILLRRRAARG